MEHPKILHNGVLVHTTNSEGKPIHSTEHGIRNFHDWFGGSKVVDEHGRPQVVYHGTGKDFNKVDTKKGSQGVFWFGTNKSEIASGDSGAESAKVIKPLYMQLHNPAGWDDYEDKSITELVRNGHDGVILPDSDKHFNGFIFKPNQVKSTTNNGLFSMKSDKLNESVDARPHKLVDKHGYEYSFAHPMIWHNDSPVHTTNSEGKPIHHTEEGIRNFHDWFGKSKMVDKHGRPQVFYHGTSEDFSEFDPTRSNANTKTGVPDATHFFSNDPEAAQSYAKEKSDFLRNKIWGEGGNVKPVYIKADKILKIDAKKDAWNNIYYKERGERTGDDWNINDLSELAKGKKYHALVVTNVHDRQHGSGKPATSVAIFKHNDVKSVYNSGNFSSKTANISEAIKNKFKELCKIQLKESVDGKTVLYHVSPFAKFDGTRKTSLDAMNDHYNALQDELDDPDNEFSNSDYTDKKRALDKLDRGITRFSAGGRVHDDISHADKDSFYATSQPDYWRDTMQDEHGTDYSKGGIYKIELHKPQEEDHVSAGMGDMAPQAIVHKYNVKRVTGPFKTMKDIK